MRYLIVNDDSNGYGSALLRGLQQEGEWATLLDCRIRGLWVYLCDKLDIKSCRNEKLKVIEGNIIKEVTDKNIDAVIFLFGGVGVSDFTLKWLKENRPDVQQIAWFYDVVDTAYKVGMKKVELLLHYFDKIYTFEVLDIPHIRKLSNAPIQLLPLFCNDYYKPLPSVVKDIDICFVGSWFDGAGKMSLRREMLKRVSKISKSRDWKFVIIGRGGWSSPLKLIRDLGAAKGFSRNIQSGPLTHEEINALYQRSKVVVNHPWDDQQGAYPFRTFEVPGSETCLVSKYMNALEKVYTSEEVVTFNNLDEMEEILVGILNDDERRERIAVAGRERTTNNHMIKNRIQDLLS